MSAIQFRLLTPKLGPVVWPVIGAVVGFLVFWIVLALGASTVNGRIFSTVLRLLPILLATALGSFAGGWAAFSAERRTQRLNKRSLLVSASNKAIFQIARLYLICSNLNDTFIKQHRDREMRAAHIDSPPRNMVPRFHFSLDEMSFLLDLPGESKAANVLFELVRYEDNYNILVGTVDMRADALRDFHEVRIAGGLMNPGAPDIKSLQEFRRLEAITNSMIRGIDETMAASIRIYEQLRSVLIQSFPGAEFVKWDHTIPLKETL